MYKFIVAALFSFYTMSSFAESTPLSFEKFSYRDIKFTDTKETIRANPNYSCTRFSCHGVNANNDRNQSDIEIAFVDNRIKEIEVSVETETLANCTDMINDLATLYKKQYSATVVVDKNLNENHEIYFVDGDIETNRGKIHVNSMCYKFKASKETKVVTSFEFADIIVDTIKEEFTYGK